MTPRMILIADDDCDLVAVLAMRCKRLGLKVLVAYDAMTALSLAHEEPPDLICLDVNMPSGSGLSVCEMLTKDEELSSIPVIMLTGRTDEETIRRCHSMCAYYVLKSSDIWQRIQPLLYELLDIELPRSEAPEGSDEAARKKPVEASARGGLSELNKTIAREVVYAQVSEERHHPGCDRSATARPSSLDGQPAHIWPTEADTR